MRPLFRSNMGIDGRHVERARARLTGYFDRLAAEIGSSGFIVGDRFSLADLAAAAVMTAIVRPPEFPYGLPDPWPPALTALQDSVAGHAAFRWVCDIYARYRGSSSEDTPRQ
jgi:glutathione S-transferase